jgi:hypothetical protein
MNSHNRSDEYYLHQKFFRIIGTPRRRCHCPSRAAGHTLALQTGACQYRHVRDILTNHRVAPCVAMTNFFFRKLYLINRIINL